MVILSMSTLAVHSMMMTTPGIFLQPVTTEFGWARGALSAAQSITMLVGGGLAILVGRLSDKYGPRPLITADGLLAGISFLLMSQINSLWQAYLIWGLLMGMAFSCSVIPISSTIPRWFTKKRGMAMGLTVAGGSIGGVIWPPLTQWLISSYDWRQAYATLGIITLIVVIPTAQFLKHSPQRIGLEPYGENETIVEQSSLPVVERFSLIHAIKTSRFWIFCSLQFCFMFIVQIINVHIVPHAVDIGILAMVAASTLSIIALLNLIGKLVMGITSDRVGARPALIACFGIFTLALIWLLFAEEAWMFYVFALLFGFPYGGVISVFTLISAELFGLRYLGTITAATFLLATIGGSVGPPLAGFTFDETGSYSLAFLICVILGALAITLSFILLRSKSYEDINPIKSGSGGI